MAYEVKKASIVSRRAFCGATLAAAAVPLTGVFAGAAQDRSGVKFFKNFAPGHIGVKANQQQALEYAVKYGYEGIAPAEGEFANKSAAEIGAWLETMKQKGIRYGAAGLPVEFRQEESNSRRAWPHCPSGRD